MSGEATPLNHQQILEALHAILSSKPLAKAQRLKALLSYVVHAKLQNQTSRINGYNIAMEVFERPESFDPQTDTVVRVAAVRLRAKLKEYYASLEQPASVQIVLPVRSYVPEFIFDEPKPEPVEAVQTTDVQSVQNAALSRQKLLIAVVMVLCLLVFYLLWQLEGRMSKPSPEQTMETIEKNVIHLEHEVAAQSVQLGDKYFQKEDYDNAAIHYQKAVNVSPGNTENQRLLGKTRFILAQYEQAKDAFESALKTDEQVDKASLTVAQDLFHLGDYYRKTRQYEQARLTYHDALILVEKHQVNTRLTAEIYRGLAQAHTFLVNDQLATDFIRKAFDAYHTLPPYMLQSSKGLLIKLYATRGLVKKRQGQLLEAIIDMVKSTELATAYYGETRSEVAQQRGNLAMMYSKTKQYGEAMNQFEQALEVTKQLFGDQHPNVAKLYNNMASTLSSQKRYGEAKAYLELALDINKNVASKYRIGYALNLYNLGLLNHSTGKSDLALGYLQRSLTFYIEAYGEQHPEIGEIWEKIGNIHRDTDDKKRAEEFYTKALNVYQLSLGAKHKTTVAVQAKLDGLTLN